MKLHNYSVRLATTFVVLAFAGCSTVYTPAPGIPSLKEIPEFPSGLKLSLVNAQPSTEKILLVSSGGSTYYANLHDWTERLNKSLKETL